MGPTLSSTSPASPRSQESAASASEALLVERIAAGDDDALAEAFDRFARVALGAARRVLGDGGAAEDVVQDVFVTLWTRPRGYDAGRAPLGAYLATLARRRAIDMVRSELRRAGREERHQRLAPEREPASVEQLTEQRVVARAVRDALRALPEEQRQVVELAYFRGLSYRDVAAVVGIPEGTAKSRLRLALAKLESMLDHDLLMELT